MKSIGGIVRQFLSQRAEHAHGMFFRILHFPNARMYVLGKKREERRLHTEETRRGRVKG